MRWCDGQTETDIPETQTSRQMYVEKERTEGESKRGKGGEEGRDGREEEREWREGGREYSETVLRNSNHWCYD